MTTDNDILNNNGVVFNADAVEGIEEQMVNDVGPMFPLLQWHTGDQKMKKAGGLDYTGGFFIKADAIDDATMLAGGWEKTTWTHDNGAEDAGWHRRQAGLAIIATRRRWEVFQENSNRPLTFAWKNYEKAKTQGRPTGRLQVLCLVKGLESAGPVVLSLRGMSALSFEGRGGDTAAAVGKFQATVITAANLASQGKGQRKRWPLFAFWLPVGADREKDGTPIFTKVGQGNNTSQICLPVALGLPAKPADVNLNTFYVGNDLLEECKRIWGEAENNWTHAWDELQPEPETATAAQEATPQQPVAAEEDLATLGI